MFHRISVPPNENDQASRADRIAAHFASARIIATSFLQHLIPASNR